MMTFKCECGGTVEFHPAHWDAADADGNRAVWVPDHWVCPDCCGAFNG